jgi:hypothetical protein
VGLPDGSSEVPAEHAEAKPLFVLELWQLVLVGVGVIVLAGRFLLGAALPLPGGKAPLMVVGLLVVLGVLLMLRKRQTAHAGR